MIVYISIIFFGWFYFDLLNNQTKDTNKLTKLITFDAILRFGKCKSKIKNNDSKDNFLFLIRLYNEVNTA